MSINKFDGILYINLAKRKDRLKSIENELIRIGASFSNSKIFRIDAILDKKNGHRGCALSHLKAVNFAIDGFHPLYPLPLLVEPKPSEPFPPAQTSVIAVGLPVNITTSLPPPDPPVGLPEAAGAEAPALPVTVTVVETVSETAGVIQLILMDELVAGPPTVIAKLSPEEKLLPVPEGNLDKGFTAICPP